MLETPCSVANGHVDSSHVLVAELGADLNVRNNMGDTPIHLATAEGHSDAIRALHELGAAVDVANHDGYTPLHCCAGYGHADATRLLVAELGADVNVRNNIGYTTLHLATAEGHSDAIRALHELGAAVDVTNDDGPSLLRMVRPR